MWPNYVKEWINKEQVSIVVKCLVFRNKKHCIGSYCLYGDHIVYMEIKLYISIFKSYCIHGNHIVRFMVSGLWMVLYLYLVSTYYWWNTQLKCALNLHLSCIKKCYSGNKYGAFLYFMLMLLTKFVQNSTTRRCIFGTNFSSFDAKLAPF